MATKHNYWPVRPIGDVGQVLGGRQRSHRITAGSPRPYLRVANVFDGYIDYSDVLEMPFTDDEFRKFALQPGDILFNEGQSLELIGRNARFDGPANKFAFQNTLVRFRAGEQIAIDYATQLFKYLFVTGRFASIARKTTSIAHLGSSRLATLEVPIPPLCEQRQIAKVLGAWDQSIRQTEKLIEAKRKLKKGLMQQLLTGKRRFPEFGPSVSELERVPLGWQEVKIGEIFKKVTRKNRAGVTRVLTASGEYGLVDQRDFFNRSVAGESLDGYIHLKKGEYAFNRSSMHGYPYGAIKRLSNYPEGVLSTLYICFALSSEEYCSDFLMHYFEAGHLNMQLRGIVQVGARAHGLLNVTVGDFFSLKLWGAIVKSCVRKAHAASCSTRSPS